jgi:hypothetical protein
MVHCRERLSSVLDSAPQKSINLAKIFKNVFNNCKNAGLCFGGASFEVYPEWSFWPFGVSSSREL